jgi:hypothetical protein
MERCVYVGWRGCSAVVELIGCNKVCCRKGKKGLKGVYGTAWMEEIESRNAEMESKLYREMSREICKDETG